MSLSMQELVEALDRLLVPGHECSRGEVQDLLAQFDIEGSDWHKYRHFDANKLYTRNLVKEGDAYTLMLLCWNADKESPIHDHPGAGCWVRVLDGTVKEQKYAEVSEADGGGLDLVDATVCPRGAVTYIEDSMGLHKVGSVGSQTAVTMHLYSPSYKACHSYSVDEGKECLRFVTYYTIDGKRNTYIKSGGEQPAGVELTEECHM